MQAKTKILTEWLVIECQTGNQKAFDQLATLWYPKIKRQIYLHLRDTTATQDLTQDCWLAIIKGIHKLKDPSKFGVWALRIASLKSYDWIRKNQLERERQSARETVQLEMSTQESYSKEEKISQLQKAIQQLPSKQQVVLNLFYLNQYSLKEMAKILKVSEGTIKSRLFHAREYLKKRMQNEK